MLNIAKTIIQGIGSGLSAGVGALRLPPVTGLTTAMSMGGNATSSALSAIVQRSIVAPSLMIGEYAFAATLSLPEHIIMQHIGPHIGLRKGPSSSAANVRNRAGGGSGN